MSFIDLPKIKIRKRIVSLGIAGLFLAAAALLAQSPDMTGTWEMDTAKSQVTDGRTVTLLIANVEKKIKINSTIHDKAGQATTGELTCAPDGKECEFNEAGHKSKVSMWFSGPALNVAKTDGPAGDVVNEWKLEMSPEGKVLTLTVSHIDPNAPEETLVFNKKSS